MVVKSILSVTMILLAIKMWFNKSVSITLTLMLNNVGKLRNKQVPKCTNYGDFVLLNNTEFWCALCE